MLPEIDMMDVGARQENLAMRGEPIMLQLCVVPAYALTVHKTQVCLLCFEGDLGSYVSPAILHDSLREFYWERFCCISNQMNV